MSRLIQGLDQHIPDVLKNNKLTVNSSIKGRTTLRMQPTNGLNGYDGNNNQIEFTLSSSDLFDLSTLVVSLDYVAPTGGTCDGFISACFHTVECYWGSTLIERIEKYNLWKNAMIVASSNDSFVANELNAMATVNGSGKYLTSLDLLGITKLKQYIPLLNNNLRIVIRVADVKQSHYRTVAGTAMTESTFKLNNVSLLVDTVQVHDAYMAQYMAAIAGPRGIQLPLQTFEVKERIYSELMNFNLSYTEADSFFGLVKYAQKLPSDVTDKPITDCPFNIESLSMSFSGKYLTPTDDFKGKAEVYMAMRKSLASLHDSSGSTFLNKTRYNDLTLIGIDGEKLPAENEVVSNGLNTRALGYSLDIKTTTSDATTAQTKFYLAVLHRKLLTLANNSIEVSK